MCGCACMGYWGLGGPAGQVVHAAPDKVYSAFEDGFSDAEQSGVVQANGQSVAYQIEVEKVRNKSIDVIYEISGEKVGHLHLGFAPEGQGDTMVTGTIVANAQKIHETLGYSTTGFPDSPVVDLGLAPMLSDAAKKIEEGMPLGKFGKRIDASNGDCGSSCRNYADEARQRAATRPMVDPDADARRYLRPSY
jgi:hypothetical protein